MKEKLKKLVSTYFENFAYFYGHIRYRLFVAIALSLLVGILDGFGLSMFLPLLQMVNDASSVDPEELGNLRFILDTMTDAGLTLSLSTVLLVLCIFFLFKGVAKFASDTYRVVVQQFFIRNIRVKMLKSLNHISYKAFVQSDIGKIQNTMTGEADRVVRGYQFYFRAFEQILLVMVYMSFAFFVDVRFALLVTVGGLFSNILYSAIYKRTKGASRNLTKSANVYQGLIIQHVANFKYLKATGLLNGFGRRLHRFIQEIETNNRRIGIYNAILTAAREPMMIIVVCAVILFQTSVLNSPLGPILISLLFFYRSLTALMVMQNNWNNFLTVSGSLENMTNFQKELDEHRENDGSHVLNGFQKQLAMNNGSFNYSGRQVLSAVSLTINKNETIGFVGESGSGKTTLVNVLAGLLPLDSGEMVVDDMPLSTIKKETYQSRIGYITQDPVIFNDSIFNNVTFWSEPSDELKKRFWEAVRKASIDDFIRSLPDAENTILGNNGINLSGGQKQRISIARELFKEVDILIMDEATSALDSETERSIQENIDLLKGMYTILIVAHRLSTVKNADRIVFMKDGSIDTIGSYQLLLKNNSRFQRMVELQEL